jgi:hypothetical protein
MLACFLKSLKTFIYSIEHLANTGEDGQFCAKCVGLAQMEQLSTLKVLANGFTHYKSFNLLGESIYFHPQLSVLLYFIDVSFLWSTSRFVPTTQKSHFCKLSDNLSNALYASSPSNLRMLPHSLTRSYYGWTESIIDRETE